MTHNPQGTPHPLKEVPDKGTIHPVFHPTVYLVSLDGPNDEMDNYAGILFHLVSDNIPRNDPFGTPHIRIKNVFKTHHGDQVSEGRTYCLNKPHIKVVIRTYGSKIAELGLYRLLHTIPPNSLIVLMVKSDQLIQRTRCWTLTDYWNYYYNSIIPNRLISSFNGNNFKKYTNGWKCIQNYHRFDSDYTDHFDYSFPFQHSVFLTATHGEQYSHAVQWELIECLRSQFNTNSKIHMLERNPPLSLCKRDPYPRYNRYSWLDIYEMLGYMDVQPQRRVYYGFDKS